MPDYISSKAGAEVFGFKKVWMNDQSLQKADQKRLEFRTIHHQKQERRCSAAKKVWMSDHSLQKAGKKRLEFRIIHHQKQERRCLDARRCEYPTIVCKKLVIKSAIARLYIVKSGSGGRCECPTIVCKKRLRKVKNARLYIIKSRSGGVWLQKGVNERP